MTSKLGVLRQMRTIRADIPRTVDIIAVGFVFTLRPGTDGSRNAEL